MYSLFPVLPFIVLFNAFIGTLLCFSQAERFRNRVVQVAFSTPGVKYPDDELPDDQLMDSLKKLIDERTNNQKQITELKDQVKQLTGQERKGDKAIRALKQHLTESQVLLYHSKSIYVVCVLGVESTPTNNSTHRNHSTTSTIIL